MSMSKYESMSLEELKAEYERVKKQNFYLQMKDRWSSEDYKTDEEHNRRILKLSKLIKERGGGVECDE